MDNPGTATASGPAPPPPLPPDSGEDGSDSDGLPTDPEEALEIANAGTLPPEYPALSTDLGPSATPTPEYVWHYVPMGTFSGPEHIAGNIAMAEVGLLGPILGRWRILGSTIWDYKQLDLEAMAASDALGPVFKKAKPMGGAEIKTGVNRILELSLLATDVGPFSPPWPTVGPHIGTGSAKGVYRDIWDEADSAELTLELSTGPLKQECTFEGEFVGNWFMEYPNRLQPYTAIDSSTYPVNFVEVDPLNYAGSLNSQGEILEPAQWTMFEHDLFDRVSFDLRFRRTGGSVTMKCSTDVPGMPDRETQVPPRYGVGQESPWGGVRYELGSTINAMAHKDENGNWWWACKNLCFNEFVLSVNHDNIQALTNTWFAFVSASEISDIGNIGFFGPPSWEVADPMTTRFAFHLETP